MASQLDSGTTAYYMLIAINYHYIRPHFDNPHPGIHGITPSQLKDQLILLSKAGSFVEPTQILHAVLGEHELPERSFIVTFDDGLREQFEYAWPVLQRLGIPALFFVNTLPVEKAQVSMVHKIHLLRSRLAPTLFLQMLRQQAVKQCIQMDLQVDAKKAASQYKYDSHKVAELKYLLNFILNPAERDPLIEACFAEAFPGQEARISRELYLSQQQITELGRDKCIGTHGHQHLPLGLLSANAIFENVQLSLLSLESWAGYRPFALSYPYGSKDACSQAVAATAARLGIAFAFTMEPAGNANLANPLLLARFDNNDLPGGDAAKWTVENLFASMPRSSWHLEQ
jgi:peptidoglycan/xylan/chitin deacetylase (PgdA/CDA1 family)